MKRIFCLFGLLSLCACDRPQYDVLLVCEDGAKGELLVDAKIYKDRADLNIKRLTKELRDKALLQGRGSMWLADHTWLYNQIPEIDDEINVSVPVNGNRDGNYELAGKIEFNLTRNSLTGGLEFMLWHMSDNNLTMNDGEVMPDGMPMRGQTCSPIIDMVPQQWPKGFTKEIKNCLNYIDSQLLYDNTPTEKRLRVYDENTGREMYIDEENFKDAFGEIEPHHFYALNAKNNYPEDAMQACDVAARLRAYIATHIDAEAIPQPQNVVRVLSGVTTTISCGDEKITVIGD